MVARSVVMASIKYTCQCMITENDGLAVRSQATALISVSLIGVGGRGGGGGTVRPSESGSNLSLR